jgi:hypothetical protein
MESRWLCLFAVLSIALCRQAAADTKALSCTNSQDLEQQGIFWACDNFGQVNARQNTTYYLTVSADSASYQQYDINITLTSITGDADL